MVNLVIIDLLCDLSALSERSERAVHQVLKVWR